jgi:L-ascorbate metabolism protein UlaG (beta-lactamase superfamily)
MEIYWLGHGCFRLRGRDATVVTDPAPPTTGYRISRLAADIVTISRDQAESSYQQAITGEPKVIKGPGEYEIAGVLMTGVRTDDEVPRDGPRNVAYVFDLDDIRICHLGSLSKRPAADEVEALSALDVLLIPVGGGGALGARAAAETVSLLEPKIVIPMRYKTEVSLGELEPVDTFLKEMGVEAKPPEARLTVTKSNLPADTTVVLLNYRG